MFETMVLHLGCALESSGELLKSSAGWGGGRWLGCICDSGRGRAGLSWVKQLWVGVSWGCGVQALALWTRGGTSGGRRPRTECWSAPISAGRLCDSALGRVSFRWEWPAMNM